jgi:hypothetical protein
LLLTALVMALREWSGLDRVQIGLEGHGRVMEGPFASCDLSRTVGWFTTIYPFTPSVQDCSDLAQAVRSVKEHFRRVPAQGLSFLPSHHTVPNDIVFNYLGQIEAGNSFSSSGLLLAVQDAAAGSVVSALNHLWSRLEVNAVVQNDALSFVF